MKPLCLLLVILSMTCSAFAGSDTPKAYMRFHVQVVDLTSEGNQALPIQLSSPPQQIYIKKYAELSEDSIASIDMIEGGKVLITFNQAGKTKLEESTSTYMNRVLVVILNGRVVYAPIIDTTLRDGKFLLPAGVTAEEVKALREVIQRKQRG